MEQKKSLPTRLLYMAVGIGIGSVVSAVLLKILYAVYYGKNIDSAVINLEYVDFTTLLAIPVIVTFMVIEVYLVGWKTSGAGRLYGGPSNSRNQDAFYLVMYLSNLMPVIGHAMSLGLAFALHAYIKDNYSFLFFEDAGILVGLVFLWVVSPFILYWFHWLQHTRFFWELHKVHHASDEMTVINGFRDHPVVAAFRGLADYLPFVIFGVHPISILLYKGMTGIIVLWQHSNYQKAFPWIEKYVLIGARGHLLHHSTEEQHYSSNLGLLVFWDWLFGSWHNPDHYGSTQMGLPDEPNFNTAAPLKEMMTTYTSSIRIFMREILGTFKRSAA